jgi:hypothetical protein
MSLAFPIIPDVRYRLLVASSNQTVFSVSFPFLQEDDVSATKIALDGTETPLVRPTNYTLTGKGNPAGGTLTLKHGVPAGTKILIVGQVVRTRATSVVRGGKYDSAALDEDIDRLTLIAQEHDRDIARSPKVPFGETPPELVTGAAGTVAMWDDDGNLVEGPSAEALDHLEAALGVDAGRALIYPASGPEVFDAGARKIGDVADGEDPQDVVTKAQLDAAIGAIDLSGIDALIARIEDLEEDLAAYKASSVTTGFVMHRASADDVTGWLLMNGQTIGSESSGATARDDDDTLPLFTLLWTKFSNTLLPIQTSGGSASTRGASAADDFAAHKRLPLPEVRGEFLRALDGGRGIDVDRVLGSAQADELEAHDHGSGTYVAANHGHPFRVDDFDDGDQDPQGGLMMNGQNPVNHAGYTGTPSNVQGRQIGGSGEIDVSGSSGETGGAETRPRNVAYPVFIKL